MLDSVADGLHHRPGRRRTLLGTDAFQETDITGVTLPITKHNYLVTRVEDIAPTIREAFYIAQLGPARARCWSTSPRTRSRRACDVDVRPTRRCDCRGYRPDAPRRPTTSSRRAAELIDARQAAADPRRPRHRHGRRRRASCARSPRRRDIPVAATLLGLGGFPAIAPAQPRHDGHARRGVGEPRDPGGRPAASRSACASTTASPATSRPTRRTRRRSTSSIDPAEINKNVTRRRRARRRRRATTLDGAAAARRRAATATPWLAHIAELKGDAAVRDIQTLPDDGQLYAAHVIHDLWRLTEGKALVVTDVGQHQMWEAQYYKHDHPRTLITSGGLGTMGFALPAAIGAQARAPRRRGLGGRRRRRLPDDRVRAGDRARRRASRSTSRSSTTATSAWCASGRSSSTTAATRRRRCKSPDFVKLAEAHGLAGAARRRRARTSTARSQRRARADGHRADRLPGRAGRPSTRWCPAGADLHDMIRRPQPPRSSRPRRTE